MSVGRSVRPPSSHPPSLIHFLLPSLPPSLPLSLPPSLPPFPPSSPSQFCKVMQNIIDQSAGKDASLQLVVAGEAGSGKSYRINCPVYSIRKFCENNKAVQVLAPTGNSANLFFSGKTIHSFLEVPCGPKSKKDKTAPVGTTAEKLQKNSEGLVCLLVDERSLVGCNLLGWMEYRCQCGMKTDKPWGGMPVVVFLDDIQLPPVYDSPVYWCNSSKPASMRGALLWQSFNPVVTLTKMISQDNRELHFKNVLQSLRTYRTTQEDTDWLGNFQWDNFSTAVQSFSNAKHGEECPIRLSNTC